MNLVRRIPAGPDRSDRRRTAAVPGALRVCAIWIACGVAAVSAVQRTLDLEAIGEAMRLGRTAVGAERARLHATYRLAVAKPPIDYIEIVTPFRRIVLATEARAARGERALAQREAIDLLARAPDRLDVYVEMTFHPFNTFVGVPAYEVVLVSGPGVTIPARAVNRIPRSGPRLNSLPPALPELLGSASAVEPGPLSGGTLAAQFDLEPLDAAGRYEVLVREGDGELGRTTVDLGRLR